MKKTFIPLLVAGTALIATGCDQKAADNTASTAPAPTPVVNKADAVAIVNGVYISKATFANLEKEISERSQGQSFPKEKLLEELIQRELLVQDALQKKLDTTPDVKDRLEEAKKQILTQADVQNYMKINPVTDAEIKAEYDSKVGGTNGTEYKARHILVKTEAEAKKLIAELDKGADFAKLANKNSLDAKDSQNGGDLGWFVAGQMVEPFSKAVIALEKGKYTKAPVQTQFGWHVILREDSRAQTPPPLEAVKEQLMPYLQRKKVQTMLENMRKQAKVEILMAPEPAKPAETAKPAEAEKPAVEIAEEVKDNNGKAEPEKTVTEEGKADAVTDKKTEATEKTPAPESKTEPTEKSTPAEAKK